MLNEHFFPSEVAGLVRRSTEINDAFMNGKMDLWQSLVTHSQDFSLLSPFGNWTVNGFDRSPEKLAAMASCFMSATTSLEIVAVHTSAEMVVLAVVERQHGIIGGLPAQDWSLRVTLVFRRKGAAWELVHRHADPPVQSIRLDQLSAIARGQVGSSGTIA